MDKSLLSRCFLDGGSFGIDNGPKRQSRLEMGFDDIPQKDKNIKRHKKHIRT